MKSGYVIIDNCNRYLVDRSITRHKWWDSNISNAMVFDYKGAAVNQCSMLRFNSPQVVPYEEEK